MQDYVHYRYMNVALGIQDGTQSKCAIEQWRNREWCVYIWLDSVLIDHIDTTMQYGYIYIQLALGNARSNNKVVVGEKSQQRDDTNSDQIYLV